MLAQGHWYLLLPLFIFLRDIKVKTQSCGAVCVCVPKSQQCGQLYNTLSYYRARELTPERQGLVAKTFEFEWINLNPNKTNDPVRKKSPICVVHRRGHWPGLSCGKSEEGTFLSVEHPGNTCSKPWSALLLVLISQKGTQRDPVPSCSWSPSLSHPHSRPGVWSRTSHVLALDINKAVGLEGRVMSTVPPGEVMVPLALYQLLFRWRITWAFKCESYCSQMAFYFNPPMSQSCGMQVEVPDKSSFSNNK